MKRCIRFASEAGAVLVRAKKKREEKKKGAIWHRMFIREREMCKFVQRERGEAAIQLAYKLVIGLVGRNLIPCLVEFCGLLVEE